ncbi:MAG: DUF1294 domain-containing protein [Candidatus Uhrbacteria bacterium]
MSRRTKTYLFWSIAWLFSITAALVAIIVFFDLHKESEIAIAIFVAANLASFFLLAFDKFQAGQKSDRVPELILFLATFFAGGIGTLLGMNLFHHKTKKISFQIVIALIILLQLGGLIFWWSKTPLGAERLTDFFNFGKLTL